MVVLHWFIYRLSIKDMSRASLGFVGFGSWTEQASNFLLLIGHLWMPEESVDLGYSCEWLAESALQIMMVLQETDLPPPALLGLQLSHYMDWFSSGLYVMLEVDMWFLRSIDICIFQCCLYCALLIDIQTTQTQKQKATKKNKKKKKTYWARVSVCDCCFCLFGFGFVLFIVYLSIYIHIYIYVYIYRYN